MQVRPNKYNGDRDRAFLLPSTSEGGNSHVERLYMKGGGCLLTGLARTLAKWSTQARARGLSGTFGAACPNAQKFLTLIQNLGPEHGSL